MPAWIPQGDTPAELADKLGIDGAELERTIERWNAAVRRGPRSRLRARRQRLRLLVGRPAPQGPPRTPRSARSRRGPYYAFEIHSGALGTKGGPRVDPDARVLDIDGDPIPGLYAAGNVMGSPFGMTYGGPGGTLGPAMVFGYLAGRHAASR